jgi:uncharacterized membrane protein
MLHYKFTRFNLKNKNWQKDREGVPVLTEEWMSDRFKLFHRYCLPSVKNQNNQNFKWLVYFDEKTSNEYKQKIKQINGDYQNFNPIFVSDIHKAKVHFAEFVKSDNAKPNNSETEKTIITSRLNNDDAVHSDFIDKVQHLSKNKPDYLIDLAWVINSIFQKRVLT